MVQNLQESGNPEVLRALVPPWGGGTVRCKASGGVLGKDRGSPAPAPSRPALESGSCPTTSAQGVRSEYSMQGENTRKRSTRTPLLSGYIKSYLKLSLLHINEIRVFGQVEILLGTDSAAASKRNTEVLGGGAQSWRWPVPSGPCPGSGSLGLGRITHLIERVGVPAGPCSSQPPAAPGT